MARRARRRSLSYKEQREFDALPARIEQLESDKAGLDALVADPAFYGRDHGAVRDTLARVARLGDEIDAAYARWAELEAAAGK